MSRRAEPMHTRHLFSALRTLLLLLLLLLPPPPPPLLLLLLGKILSMSPLWPLLPLLGTIFFTSPPCEKLLLLPLLEGAAGAGEGTAVGAGTDAGAGAGAGAGAEADAGAGAGAGARAGVGAVVGGVGADVGADVGAGVAGIGVSPTAAALIAKPPRFLTSPSLTSSISLDAESFGMVAVMITLPASRQKGSAEKDLCVPYCVRRRHVYCAGMDVSVLKMAASARRPF